MPITSTVTEQSADSQRAMGEAVGRYRRRVAAGVDEALAQFAMSIERELVTTETELVAHAVSVTQAGARAASAIKEGRALNGLGELQQTGQRFDMLCAERERLRQLVMTLNLTIDHQ